MISQNKIYVFLELKFFQKKQICFYKYSRDKPVNW